MDYFKGSLTSKNAGKAVKQGVKRVFPECMVDVIPIAEGGEGSLEAVQILPGHSESVSIHQLDGKKKMARYYRTKQAAYIECAEAVGLHLIAPEKLKPSRVTSYGVGKLARKHNLPCFALARQVLESVDYLYPNLTGVFSIQQGCHSLEHALNPDVTKSQLAFSAEQVMRVWSSGRGN